MRALLTDDAVTPFPVAIDDEIFTQQPKCFDRLLLGELADACNRHPVPPQHLAGRLATTDLGQHFIFFTCEHINSLAVPRSKFKVHGSATSGQTLNFEPRIWNIERQSLYFPFSAVAMISLARSKMGFMSPYSGFTTSKYFTPACSRLSGGMSSLGISMRRELAGSSTSPSFCSAICPLRERNQLMKTLAAFGCGAWII